jgi:hypothetical protein
VVVSSRDRVATFDDPSELLELAPTEGRLHVGQPVVEAVLGDFVVPAFLGWRARDPVRAERAKSVGEVVVIGGDDAAFSRGDGLHRMEGEAGHLRVGAVADRPIRRQGAERMRSILDHHTRPVCQLGEIDREARVVNGDERVKAFANSSRIEVESGLIDVDELDVGSDVPGAVRRRDE